MQRRKTDYSGKSRILRDISRSSKDLSRIKAWFVGRWKKDKNKEKELLDWKYELRRIANGRTEIENK